MENDVMISRAALIEALMTYTWRDDDERLIDDADEKREFIKQWLPDVPAVDAVPVRHGYWIDREGQYECSECHNIACCKGKYCTDCGAKMDDSSPTCSPDYCEIGGGDDE